jgi:protein-tyrosine phosphatase
MQGDRKFRVLMVCLGNICRSPTAEGVFRHRLRRDGLDGWVEVDSAGTSAWHDGAPPDRRSQQHARRRGYDLSAQRSRPVRPTDFSEFDLLLAMDFENLEELQEACPPEHRHKLKRLMEYARRHRDCPVVPDPYQGADDHFEQVLDLIEDACDGLAEHLAGLVRGNFQPYSRPN